MLYDLPGRDLPSIIGPSRLFLRSGSIIGESADPVWSGGVSFRACSGRTRARKKTMKRIGLWLAAPVATRPSDPSPWLKALALVAAILESWARLAPRRAPAPRLASPRAAVGRLG